MSKLDKLEKTYSFLEKIGNHIESWEQAWENEDEDLRYALSELFDDVYDVINEVLIWKLIAERIDNDLKKAEQINKKNLP